MQNISSRKFALFIGLILVCNLFSAFLTVHAETYNFTLKWGSYGSANGQFNNPFGVAVSGSGIVFIADTFNNRVQIFSSTGIFANKWGSTGSGTGQLNGPFGIALDGSGNVYVTDNGNNRVEKFSSTGSFLLKWGTYGSGNGQFDRPLGIAVDNSGYVYVADYGNNRIEKFSNTGVFLAKWGGNGTANGQFNGPYGVAVDSSGNVYAADYGNSRVEKFSSSGAFLAKWGSHGSGNGQFNGPEGIAVDSSGNIFVTDTGNNRVQKFNSAGTFVTQWGSSGSENNQFIEPVGIGIDGFGGIYVADAGNFRVQKFAAPPSPTSTPTITPTPTPIATATPTPLPTGSPTPSPFPTSTPTITPTPTPIATPNPTATGTPTQLAASIYPTSSTVIEGQLAAFAITPSGGMPPYKYLWYEGTTIMTGQTSATLTITKNAAGTHIYRCKVIDSESNTANSNPATLAVNPTPTQLTALISQSSSTVIEGQLAAFAITPSGVAPPFAYQWYEGTNPLLGDTSATLSVSKSTPGSYNFYCKITDNTLTTTTSNAALLTVIPKLTTSISPSSATGNSATFTVTAVGGLPPYSYQWYEEAAPMVGQTSATLTVTKTNSGTFNFHCSVTDSAELPENVSTRTVSLSVGENILVLLIGISTVFSLGVVIILVFWAKRKKNPKATIRSPSPPSKKGAPYVFISHVEEDRDIAVAEGLEEAGYETWYYERDSIIGPSYLLQTKQAVENAQAIIVIISLHSLSSRQVTAEVVRAHEAGIPFLPLLHDISHAEFQRRQPEWQEAIGSAASYGLPKQGVTSIMPKISAGLEQVGVKKKNIPS
jgi:sugar lactone lactonase YvrE